MENNSPILMDSPLSSPDVNRDIQAEGQKARAVSEIQSALVIAQKFPRQEAVCFSRISASLRRLNFANKASYSFPRGVKNVTGPSVVFARELSRLWGNIWTGITVVHDSDEERTVEGWAWDLETNVRRSSQSSFKKLVQRKVYSSDGKTSKTDWVKPDERDLRELTNKHGAICERNSMLQLLPGDIIDDCMNMARKIVIQNIDVSNIDKERGEILRKFKTKGIELEDLEAYIQTKLENWAAEEIATLIGLFTSIQDGQVKKSEIVRKQTMSAPKQKGSPSA